MARRASARNWWALLAPFIVGVALITAPLARADDVIWGGLILAENPSKDAAPKTPTKWPAALAGREKQISRIFGYKELNVIGQAQQTIKTGEEDWLVPSKRFYLKVDTKNPIPHGYLLALELYQEDKLLVEATIKLARGNPLYIRGPQVGSGQLIIALVADGKDAAWTKTRPIAAQSRAAMSPEVTPPSPTTVPKAAPAASLSPEPSESKPSPSPATVPAA